MQKITQHFFPFTRSSVKNMYCKEKIEILENYSEILQTLNYIYQKEENEEIKEKIAIVQEKIIEFREINNDFSTMIIKENRQLEKLIFGKIDPNKKQVNKKIRCIKKMENDFRFAFALIANNKNIKNNIAYAKLYNVRKMYNFLKGGEI